MANIISANAHNPNLTMTSREIAELVESRHDHVKRSIDRLVNQGIISPPPMGGSQNSTRTP